MMIEHNADVRAAHSPIAWRKLPGPFHSLEHVEPLRPGEEVAPGCCVAMPTNLDSEDNRLSARKDGWALYRFEGDAAWRRITHVEYPPQEGAHVVLRGDEWRWKASHVRRRTRWRTLVVLQRDRVDVWATVPGWDPKVQVLVWSDDSIRLIPEHIASTVLDGHILRLHASLNIAATHYDELDFQGAEDWDREGAMLVRRPKLPPHCLDLTPKEVARYDADPWRDVTNLVQELSAGGADPRVLELARHVKSALFCDCGRELGGLLCGICDNDR